MKSLCRGGTGGDRVKDAVPSRLFASEEFPKIRRTPFLPRELVQVAAKRLAGHLRVPRVVTDDGVRL
jgi:hypothetical protein